MLLASLSSIAFLLFRCHVSRSFLASQASLHNSRRTHSSSFMKKQSSNQSTMKTVAFLLAFLAVANGFAPMMQSGRTSTELKKSFFDTVRRSSLRLIWFWLGWSLWCLCPSFHIHGRLHGIDWSHVVSCVVTYCLSSTSSSLSLVLSQSL